MATIKELIERAHERKQAKEAGQNRSPRRPQMSREEAREAMIKAGFDVPHPRKFGPKTGDKNSERDQNFSTPLQGETIMKNENIQAVESTPEASVEKVAKAPHRGNDGQPSGISERIGTLQSAADRLERRYRELADETNHLTAQVVKIDGTVKEARALFDAQVEALNKPRPFNWKETGISIGTAVATTAAVGGTVIGLMWVAGKVLGEEAAPAADSTDAVQPFGTT